MLIHEENKNDLNLFIQKCRHFSEFKKKTQMNYSTIQVNFTRTISKAT